MTNPIQLVALDIDGTLATENDHVSSRTREALSKLHDDGIKMAVATGRSYRSSLRVIDALGFDTYCICNGGALVKQPDGSTIHLSVIERACFLQIVGAARSLGIALSAQRDSHTQGGADFILDSEIPWNEQDQKSYRENERFAESADILGTVDQYLSIGACTDKERMNAFANSLQHLPDINTIITPLSHASGYWYGEITHSSVNKWKALTHLARHLSIPGDNICAVGDQLNDLTMIESAGHSFAMGSGHEELKSIADFVCGNHLEDGLLEMVAYIREFNGRFAQGSGW